MIPDVAKSATIADTLSIRAIHPVTEIETTLASAKVAIFSASGTALVTSTAATVSGSLASYSRTWTWEPGEYRAEWEMTASWGGTFGLTQHFVISRYRWRRPIGSADFASRYPYLTASLPTGTTWDTYLSAAWSRIGAWLYSRTGRHPGMVWFPEVFSAALEYQTLADVYRALTITTGAVHDSLADQYQTQASSALDAACSHLRVDADGDGLVDDGSWILTGAEFVR
jgi:hypothetical protein